jgi:hypothetical protein
MIAKVPVKGSHESPPNPEIKATETTVPGRINGAMIARSKIMAPLGLRLSVM